MKTGLVSIIVAVYNAHKYLDECVNTLLRQTYEQIEIILVDDGSKDNSLSICRKYENDYENVFVYAKENEGSASARNLGLSHASGEYVIFVDADDEVSEDYIEKLYSGVQGHDVVICGFDRFNENGIQVTKILKTDGVISREAAYEHTFASNIITGAAWNKLFRTEILNKYNIKFSREIFKSEDTLFVAEYYAHCESFAYIGENLYHYRMNPESKTQEIYMHKVFNPKKNTMIDVGERVVSLNENSNQQIRAICYYRQVRCCLWVMMQWIITGYYDKAYAKKMKHYSQKYGKIYRSFSYATQFQKYVVLGMAMLPRVVWLVGKLVYSISPNLIKSKEA